MGNKIAVGGLWAAIGVLLTGAAWAVLTGVAPRVTGPSTVILSEREVDAAANDPPPLTTSSGPPPTASAPAPLPATTTASPVTTSSPSPTEAAPAPTEARPTTTRATSGSTAPTTTAVTGSPTTTAPTTTVAAKVVPVTTPGGTAGFSCTGTSTVQLVYATPMNGYTYAPLKVTAAQVEIVFRNSPQAWYVQAECSDGSVQIETSSQADD